MEDYFNTGLTASVFYKFCTDSCHSNDNNKDGFMEIKNTATAKGEIKGSLRHHPRDCKGSTSCQIVFRFKNPDKKYMNTYSFMVELITYNHQDIDIDKDYHSIVPYGQYVNYEVNPTLDPAKQEHLASLKITARTLIGDTDLYVSFKHANPTQEHHDFMSRTIESTNQVELVNSPGISLNRSIFFSLYGNVKSEVKITFEYTMKPSYNEYLERSKKLFEGTAIKEEIKTENDDRFYSYSPWWSPSENREIVILSDMLYNKVLFYASWNHFPKHFKTTLHSKNDVIVIKPTDKDYHIHGGNYYIRLRPDFNIGALIADAQYVYNMYAFGQVTDRPEYLVIGRKQIGFATVGKYVDYRYLMIDFESTYTINVENHHGHAKFYVKTMDGDSMLLPRDKDHHFSSVDHPKKGRRLQTLNNTQAQRSRLWGLCNSYFRSVHTDGSLKCLIAVGVTCLEGEKCVFKIYVQGHKFRPIVK